MKIIPRLMLLCAVCLISLNSCLEHDELYDTGKPYSRVFIYYAAANNSLSGLISSDIQDIMKAPVPHKSSSEAVLIFKHLTGESPMLLRAYSDLYGNVSCDTLDAGYRQGECAIDTETLKKTLSYIGDTFPSNHYGLLLSSHGTGWLPDNYYLRPEEYEAKPTRSFGEDRGRRTMIDIDELAGAIPIHLDYIIFDACLMGCIEVAYELKDVTDRILFSQAEIPGEGMDYELMMTRLLKSKSIRLDEVAQDYYLKYKDDTRGKGCTVSVVNTDDLEGFGNLCRMIFENQLDKILAVDRDSVQCFLRFNRGKGGYPRWFFDFRDIMDKAGIDETNMEMLDRRLDQIIEYNAASTAFMTDWSDGFDINTSCGISMYIPEAESTNLNNFYRNLAWNRETGLIE